MTNENAIDELSVIYERLSHPENCERGVYSFRDGDYLKALDIAIKALETGEVYMTGEDYNLYMEGYKAGKKDFEPNQGAWITVKQDTILGNFEVKNKVCDQCNHATKYEYPFCPWCGADMRGEE